MVVSPIREDLMEKPLNELIAGALFSQHSFSVHPQATLKKVKQLFMGVISISSKKTTPSCLSILEVGCKSNSFSSR